jgi:oligoribonuclease
MRLVTRQSLKRVAKHYLSGLRLPSGWVGWLIVSDRLVWIDCEMTGLDLTADALIEVAALVTDFDLNVLGDGVDLVIKPPAEAVTQMDPYVRTMHERSGLLQELDEGITLGEAEAQVLAYIRQHCAEGSRPPLAGNTVATDRSFLIRDMPTLESFLHYRIVDVSSIKELSRRWFPRAYFHAPAKRGNHRALADIQESIEELRYYRDAVFVAPPGPDSETVKEIATRHGGALTGLVHAPTDPADTQDSEDEPESV